jgi:diguanylate cyclase (GGDEF)-like protein
VVVLPASSGQKAIDAVRAQQVDLVVLATDMPGLNGIDACKVIKNLTNDRFVPVVLLTTRDGLAARAGSVTTEADDHVAKPFEDSELLARIENLLRMKRAREHVEFAKNELRVEPFDARLGSLPDHRYFHACLEIEFEEAERHLDPLACCILSVEGFRGLVSKQGADRAARILDEASDRLQQAMRPTDIAARFRTAEFGLLLPNTRPAKALALADRLVSAVALRPFVVDGASIDLVISIGIGLYPSGTIRKQSELLDAATIAVARARLAGPNRVCVVQHQGYIFQPTLPGAA